MDVGDVVDVGPAAVLAAELDRCGALLARVLDRLAHHPQVCLAVVRDGKLEPLRLGDAVAVQQRLAELVLDVQVRRRREDEVRHVFALVAQLVDHTHGRVDVAFGRAHHAYDLELWPQLAALAAFEHEAQRLPLPLRHRRETDVHHVHSDVGEHSRELVLVLGGDRHTGHLLPVPESVVVDPDLVRRRKFQVVGEAFRVPRELFERFLKLDGP